MLSATVETTGFAKININMRCIEIMESKEQIYKELVININMRCIEMKEINKSEPTSYTININMRCIEI